MFRATIHMFSGRPDPTWIVVDPAATDSVLATLGEQPETWTARPAGFTGLGFRGVEIEFFGDDHRADSRIPDRVMLADASPDTDLRAAAEVVRPLIEAMPEHGRIPLPEHVLTPPDTRAVTTALRWLDIFVEHPPVVLTPEPIGRGPLRRTVPDRLCSDCQYEISRFNPNFWNADANVRRSNNCYNYGRNWRTNTFAQPGRASGQPLGSVFTGADVVVSAMSDGLRKRCDCLPAEEFPRRMVALVYAPDFEGTGYPDYHWYREQIGGFWGHKPGGGTARNLDNSNTVITNPEACDRGTYTEFHGYFCAGRSVVIV
ncbi:MAG TPA: hypothetical protein VI357_02275 [Mycobacteriales bacterium]